MSVSNLLVSNNQMSSQLQTRSDNQVDASRQLTKAEQKLRDVSRLYEKQFLREMVKAMRSTVTASTSNQPSFGEQIYRTQLDEQYVEAWGDQGGVGLSDLIYKELSEKILPQSIHSISSKPLRKIEIKKDYPDSTNKQSIQLRLHSEPLAQIVSPMSAIWRGSVDVGGQKAMILEHPNNLSSRIVFDGTVRHGLVEGQEIPANYPIAALGPNSNTMIWNIQKS